MILEPDQWSDMSDASDISDQDRIYPNQSQCQCSRTRPEARYVWYIGYVRPRLDISNLEPMPRFWNPMKISDLVRYIRYNEVLSNLVINICPCLLVKLCVLKDIFGPNSTSRWCSCCFISHVCSKGDNTIIGHFSNSRVLPNARIVLFNYSPLSALGSEVPCML
jgi:hypothetical protein